MSMIDLRKFYLSNKGKWDHETYFVHSHVQVLESLPPVIKEGSLERKHELQSGKKKATIRSWKSFYVVLCGDILCFFKDKEHFEELSSTASQPLVIHRANVTVATDYTKKKNVFRLQLLDGAEFLFHAPDENAMMDWIMRIERQAGKYIFQFITSWKNFK